MFFIFCKNKNKLLGGATPYKPFYMNKFPTNLFSRLLLNFFK
jgi:hypothetical protein